MFFWWNSCDIYIYMDCALPVFSIFQFLVLYLSFSGISYSLLKKLPSFAALAGTGVLLCFIGMDCYCLMNFTKTAGVAAVGGINLMFAAREERQRSGRFALMALGFVLALAGLGLRVMEFFACAALMLPLGIYLLRHSCGKSFSLKAAANYALPFVVLLLVCMGLWGADWIIWSRSDCGEYRNYSNARSRVFDYGLPEYDDMPELYQSLGLDESTVALGQSFNIEQWTEERLEKTAAARDAEKGAFSLGRYLGVVLDECLHSFFEQRHIYCFLGFVLLWLAGGRRDWLSYGVLLSSLFIFLGLYLYLAYNGRCLVNRTDLGFFLALSVTLLWLINPERMHGEKFFCTLLLCCAVFLFLWQSRSLISLPQSRAGEPAPTTSSRVERLLADGHGFFHTLVSFDMNICTPLETVPENYAEKIFAIGGWWTGHPGMNELMAAYGVEIPYRDLVNNDSCYLIAYDIDKVMEHVRHHYFPQAQALPVEPLSSETGLRIWRLVSEG